MTKTLTHMGKPFRFESVQVRDDFVGDWGLENPGSWSVYIVPNFEKSPIAGVEIPLFPNAVNYGFCTVEDLQSIFPDWE